MAAESVRPLAERGSLSKRNLASSDVRAKPADPLTAPAAAKLLGVSSPNTVKNWLEGGHFPGAYRTMGGSKMGGHWRFPRADVLAVKARMEALREKNRAGDLSPPDCDDDFDPPAL